MNSTSYLKKFKESKRSENQLCADMIYEGFRRKIPYKMLMGIVSRQGRQAAIEIYNEVMKSDCDDKVKLFKWRIGKNKILFK